ncbi:GNAT family N-acetyltransferase [Aliicoccus persicus]|uniref:Diamine N-acetyltransferase n=1 Tax=Aliicoccus persicus TaxID=930138 RepID=A0A662Z4Z2_9STAP|nr:GNAT family N-acetyltransferase [Aliicoccus persicus]SEW15354.1 diamine N-acetyltransferase [Aliicoccus persicus]
MDGLTIRNIDEANIEVVKNVTMKKDQESFIESVEECLEEAAEYEQWCPVAIYHEEEVVGFAMYGAFGKNPDTWIDRIIIDQAHQGKGYGKQAIHLLIDIVTKKYQVNVVYLSFVKENVVAKQLYENMGFTFTGEYDPEGELIYKYDLVD